MAQEISSKKSGTLNGMHRLTARVALASGATIATLIGAQTFATLEHSNQPKDTSAAAFNSAAATLVQASQAVTPNIQASATPQPGNTPIATNALRPAPPHLVVFRDGGNPVNTPASAAQDPSGSATNRQSTIAPPVPVAVKPPVQAAVPAAQQGGNASSVSAVQPAPNQPQPITKRS